MNLKLENLANVMCVLMPHGSDVLRDSFGAVVDVLSLFWG